MSESINDENIKKVFENIALRFEKYENEITNLTSFLNLNLTTNYYLDETKSVC